MPPFKPSTYPFLGPSRFERIATAHLPRDPAGEIEHADLVAVLDGGGRLVSVLIPMAVAVPAVRRRGRPRREAEALAVAPVRSALRDLHGHPAVDERVWHENGTALEM